MNPFVNQVRRYGMPFSNPRETVLAVCVLALFPFVFSPSVSQEKSGGRSLSEPENPKYEHLFNCLCQMKVEDGEVDASQNCGKPLANCSCSFSERMRNKLLELDRKGLGRKEQIEVFKEEYGKFGNRVLAVPDPASHNWILAYLVPPVVIVLAVLFVGGIGWYWIEDRIRSGDEWNPERDRNVDQERFEEEIEREIEEYRQS